MKKLAVAAVASPVLVGIVGTNQRPGGEDQHGDDQQDTAGGTEHQRAARQGMRHRIQLAGESSRR